MEQHPHCPECGWHFEDDSPPEPEPTQAQKDAWAAWANEQYRLRNLPLDSTKIDYRLKPHSSASMIVEGVYPKGTTQAQVREKVDGTFGGRFEYFSNGKFKFIAYTD